MTQINFVVDCSGSMGATAYNPLTYSLRRFLNKDVSIARWELVGAIIEYIMSKSKDETFQVVEFESYPNVLVPPSKGDAARLHIYKQRQEVLKNPPTPPSRDKYGNYIEGSGMKKGYLPFYPRGGTNIPEGLKATLKGVDKNDKNITIIITDMWDQEGTFIANALNSDCGTGESCFKALADLGPVYTIIMGEHDRKVQMQKSCMNLDNIISKDYGINWNGCFSVPLNPVASPEVEVEYFTDLLLKLTKV